MRKGRRDGSSTLTSETAKTTADHSCYTKKSGTANYRLLQQHRISTWRAFGTTWGGGGGGGVDNLIFPFFTLETISSGDWKLGNTTKKNTSKSFLNKKPARNSCFSMATAMTPAKKIQRSETSSSYDLINPRRRRMRRRKRISGGRVPTTTSSSAKEEN